MPIAATTRPAMPMMNIIEEKIAPAKRPKSSELGNGVERSTVVML